MATNFAQTETPRRDSRGPVRTFEQSTVLIDTIVGRCVREREFAERVLREPEAALAEYDLNDAEMGDFRALKAQHAETAAEQWAILRKLYVASPK